MNFIFSSTYADPSPAPAPLSTASTVPPKPIEPDDIWQPVSFLAWLFGRIA